MDLVTHINSIVNTAGFTPGVNTPAPWNIQHEGLTDGTSPNNASRNMAEIYNRLLLERAALIQASGLTIDNNNWTQMTAAVIALIKSLTPKLGSAILYVRTDGSDANLGVSNTAAGAFLTIQKALDVASTYYAPGGEIRIILGLAGTYAAASPKPGTVGTTVSYTHLTLPTNREV